MELSSVKEARVNTLEAKYIEALATKDQATMDRAVGDLMSIHGIDKGDKRIADLKKRKVSNFNRDYRSGSDFASKWIMGESPYVEHVEVIAREHEGVRIEGNYEGKITIPQRTLKLDIREVKNSSSLNNIKESIKALDTRCKRKGVKIPDTFKDSAYEGKYAVYKVELNFAHNFTMNEFGYVILSRLKNDNIRALVMLDTVGMQENYIDSVQVENDIANKMSEALKRLNSQDTIETKIVGRDAK